MGVSRVEQNSELNWSWNKYPGIRFSRVLTTLLKFKSAWPTWYSGLKFSSSWWEQQEVYFSKGRDMVFLFWLKEENTIVKLGSLVSQTEWLEISEKNSNVKSHRSKNQIRHSSLVKSIWKLQSVKTPKWSRNSTLHTHAVSSIIQSICQLSIQCPTPLQLG